MSRAQRNKRLGKGSGANIEQRPTAQRAGNAVTKRTGLERPDVATESKPPRNKAAIIKTNS